MKLDELHVDQLGAGFIRERMSVAGVFPTVARDFIGASNSTSCENDCLRAKNFEAAAFALVTKRADRAIAILQYRQDGVLHVDVDPAMHTVILQCANHF